MPQDTQLTIDFEEVDNLSKEELKEFIKNEMLLSAEEQEVHWSYGILLLVQHGMKRWDEETDIHPQTFQHELNTAYEMMRKHKREYEERLEYLRKENKRLRWHNSDEGIPRAYEERLENLRKENEQLRWHLSDVGVPRAYEERLEDLLKENQALRWELSDA